MLHSNKFKVLHDDDGYIAYEFGSYRHAIFRVKRKNSNQQMSYFNFAVIWDTSHMGEERIIEALEQLYEEDFPLENYIIFQERKGQFYAVFSPYIKQPVKLLPEYIDIGDVWYCEEYTLPEFIKRTSSGSRRAVFQQCLHDVQQKWSLGKKLVIKQKPPIAPRKRQKTIEEPWEDSIVKKIGPTNVNPPERQISMYAFPKKTEAEEQEVIWQEEATAKFFRVGKSFIPGKQSFKIYNAIVSRIDSGSSRPIFINNLCRRSFIIALSKILTTCGKMPELSFRLGGTKDNDFGSTIIKFMPSPKYARYRQAGNFKMEIVGEQYDIAYGNGCITRLQYLTNPSWDKSAINRERREKALLMLMKQRLQLFKPFSHENLNKYGNINIGILSEKKGDPNEENIQSNVNFLNGLLFLVTIVEVLVRLYRTEEGYLYDYDDDIEEAAISDQFPVAIAQARSLQLLLSEKITFEDFFGESKNLPNSEEHRALYGCMTGIGTIDNINVVENKLRLVNEEYNRGQSNCAPWKNFKQQYMAANPHGWVIRGKLGMFDDLKSVYGSGSESDSETSDYSDEESTAVANEVIRFKRAF